MPIWDVRRRLPRGSGCSISLASRRIDLRRTAKALGQCRGHGQVAEWSIAHAWKACVGESLPRVRIPLCPPHIPLKYNGFPRLGKFCRHFRDIQTLGDGNFVSAPVFPTPKTANPGASLRSRGAGSFCSPPRFAGTLQGYPPVLRAKNRCRQTQKARQCWTSGRIGSLEGGQEQGNRQAGTGKSTRRSGNDYTGAEPALVHAA